MVTGCAFAGLVLWVGLLRSRALWRGALDDLRAIVSPGQMCITYDVEPDGRLRVVFEGGRRGMTAVVTLFPGQHAVIATPDRPLAILSYQSTPPRRLRPARDTGARGGSGVALLDPDGQELGTLAWVGRSAAQITEPPVETRNLHVKEPSGKSLQLSGVDVHRARRVCTALQ
jgi:hypothetical protein